MRTPAVSVIFVILGMMSSVCCSRYQKSDFMPLFGSPLSDQAPKYCAEADDEVQKSTLPNCTKDLKKLSNDLLKSLSGTTAKMKENSKLGSLLNVGGPARKKQSASAPIAPPASAPAPDVPQDVLFAYVPPLDGVRNFMSVDSSTDYSMKFVLFEIKLVSLTKVDSLGSSFTAQWQMLMEWEDLVIDQTNITSPPTNPNCKFWCDTTRPYSLCCDNTWVPPLRIPDCNIDSIDSKVDYFPPVFKDVGLSSQIYNGQRCQKKKGHCYKKVFWSVNMQTTCDTKMNFKNFPFDTQELQMDIYNPYSSRTWLQFVTNILRYNGGDIISYAPPLNGKVPSWEITKVAVSRKCSLPTWRQTFSTQNSLLMQWQNSTANYTSQEQIIEDVLTNCTCGSSYTDLDISDNVILADPSDYTIYDQMFEDYYARFNDTSDIYQNCVASHGANYTLNDSSGIFSNDNLKQLLGSWLDVTAGSSTKKIAFNCLINATANLTTPIITVSIMLQRYRRFYVMKLYAPAILCAMLTFSVVGISPSPKNFVNRLSIIVSSTLALSGLQVAITATDVPAVPYIVPTSYLVLITYVVQIFVALETIVLAKWKIGKSNRGQHAVSNDESSSFISQPCISSPFTHQPHTSVMNIMSSYNVIGHRGAHQFPIIRRMFTCGLQFKNLLVGCSKRQVDIAILFVLGATYIIVLSLCLLLPYYSGKREAIKSQHSFTIWPNPN